MTLRRTVFGREIEFSNLDKVFFPDADIRKGDVIDYYQRIANVMLPHVRGRPLSMHRWPDGIEGEDFYQKEVPDYFPEWICTVNVDKEGGTNRQVVADEPATLVYLAQQASLTPHLWSSRADELRRPDRMIFDLDPPTDDWRCAFDDVRWAARRIRALLEQLECPPFVMTSGSKGLHVRVPLERRLEFTEVKRFTRDVARLLARRHDDRLTVEMRKNERRGRVFLDYLRNDYAQTAVAPYGLRAQPGAPVATPLDWDELSRSGMNPRRYTLLNLFRRLGSRDDPWATMDHELVRLDGWRRQSLDELLDQAGLAADD